MWRATVLNRNSNRAVRKASFTASLKLSLGKTKQSGERIKRETEELQ